MFIVYNYINKDIGYLSSYMETTSQTYRWLMFQIRQASGSVYTVDDEWRHWLIELTLWLAIREQGPVYTVSIELKLELVFTAVFTIIGIS